MLARLFFLCVGRPLVWLRYRVQVEGLEQVQDLRGPVLVLPNHPGYIDPVLVLTHLGAVLPLRPLVVSTMYRLPALNPLLRFLRALEVPDLAQFNRSARAQVDALIATTIQGLDAGGQFLIYPSGRVERRGLEVIGANRAVAEILHARPEITVILVRTTGVWGSMSTFAETGKLPDLGRCFIRAVGILLANLIFFTPRREIKLTLERLDLKTVPGLEREKLNPFLEAWYNRGLSPVPKYVPYHFWFGPRTKKFPDFKANPDVPLEQISPETKKTVADLLAEKLRRPLAEKETAADTSLEGLGLDSLQRMEVAMEIEQRFGFRSQAIAGTLGELWGLAQGLLQTESGPPLPVPEIWFAERNEPEKELTFSGDTLIEAFLHQALARPQESIVADDLSGVVTYERLLLGVRLLARRFAVLPGEAVGLLLPASVAADTTVLALLLAGKRPVLLNWTTGPAQLAHAATTMKLERVITSRKFLDRIAVEVPGTSFTFLEDVRQTIGKVEGLRTLLTIRFFGRALLRQLPPAQRDDIAVVLFTSGSEKAPKAVPLTHGNILHDIQAGAVALELKHRDILLGFLPPFHSFGLSANIFLPLAGGLRVVHHADPTDAHGLARKIAAYRLTVLLTTPTFFSYILGVSQPADLVSLRLIITGAEKCPESVRARAQLMAPHAVITEGYGITECSPVVAVGRPRAARPGTVGQPLDGVTVCVVHPETMVPLPPGERGLLLVNGPTVFPGYLAYDGPSPFYEREGVRWYITGDLAQVDAEGFITFAGRLKRFIKSGGEMISLPALEEPLAERFPPSEEGPQVAVEGVEKEQGRLLVLFTTRALSLAEANGILAQAGFRGIMRLDEVRRLEKIPVLGTGKTDYKVLRAQL